MWSFHPTHITGVVLIYWTAAPSFHTSLGSNKPALNAVFDDCTKFLCIQIARSSPPVSSQMFCCTLRFQRREGALHTGIVITVASAAYTDLTLLIPQQIKISLTDVLGVQVTVMQQSLWLYSYAPDIFDFAIYTAFDLSGIGN